MAKHVPRIISAVVGLALIGGGIYLLVTGHTVEGGGLIAGGLGTVGLQPLVGATKGGES